MPPTAMYPCILSSSAHEAHRTGGPKRFTDGKRPPLSPPAQVPRGTRGIHCQKKVCRRDQRHSSHVRRSKSFDETFSLDSVAQGRSFRFSYEKIKAPAPAQMRHNVPSHHIKRKCSQNPGNFTGQSYCNMSGRGKTSQWKISRSKSGPNRRNYFLGFFRA